MQLVGQTCAHCRERVARESDARFCPHCGLAVHYACSQRALAALVSGSCRACGAPTAEKARHARKRNEPPKEPSAPRGYLTVLLGVTLMVGGILGSMCFTGAAGHAQLYVAGGSIFSGVVLVAVGFLQSRP